MSNKYRISAIHAELLEHLTEGEGMVYHINDPKVLKEKIKYKSYDESMPIVQFVLDSGIELFPNDKDNQDRIDLQNTIAIRELINNINSWRLSCFVKDMFYLVIKSGLEMFKYDKYFSLSCQSGVSELRDKEHYLNEAVKAGRTPRLNDYLSEYQYILSCRHGAEQRWGTFKFGGEHYGISKRQYIRIDYVFGMVDLFGEHFERYKDYIYESWEKVMEDLPKSYNYEQAPEE